MVPLVHRDKAGLPPGSFRRPEVRASTRLVFKPPQVGDAAAYVPSEAHALDRDPVSGRFPWVLGVKEVVPQTGKITVRELTDREAGSRIEGIRRRGNKAAAEDNLPILVAPAMLWPATVTAVNPDGTVDADVRPPHSAVTLHYHGVPFGGEELPHTCHPAAAEEDK